MSIKLFNTLCAVIKVARQLRGKMKWKKCLSPIIDLPAVYRLVTGHLLVCCLLQGEPPISLSAVNRWGQTIFCVICNYRITAGFS